MMTNETSLHKGPNYAEINYYMSLLTSKMNKANTTQFAIEGPEITNVK